MKRSCLIAVIAVLCITPLVGRGQGGANQPPDIQMKMPWRAWEFGYNAGWAGASREQQVSEPFKMFDNMYYVGLQGNSVLLLTTSDGLMLIDSAVAAARQSPLMRCSLARASHRHVRH